MVIHSNPNRKKKKPIVKQEVKPAVPKKVPEKKLAIETAVKTVPVEKIEDPTAEEFIANLPKKQTRKKVTKIIEE